MTQVTLGGIFIEDVAGIEPASSLWKSVVVPINYTSVDADVITCSVAREYPSCPNRVSYSVRVGLAVLPPSVALSPNLPIPDK